MTMKTSLERRILIFSLLALALTIMVNTGFNVASFHNSYRDGILRRCDTLANGFRRQIENVLSLGLPLSGIEGLSERCQELAANDPEISYCLVETGQGQILYHSAPPYPENTSVSYIGRLSDNTIILSDPLLGKLYDYSTPLYDYNDQVVGRVRIGFQKSILEDLTVDHFFSSLAILGAAFILVFSLIVLFARYNLVLPIQRLCQAAKEIASGRFEIQIPQLKARELQVLSDSLGEMATSLHERDQRINENFQELEMTNRELQLSYESLERISSELGRNREMYRSLLEDASDAILVCDESDNLILVNKAAEQFFGLPKERISGSNYFSFLELLNCRDVNGLFAKYQQAQPGKSQRSEFRFVRTLDQRPLLGWATCSAIVGRGDKRLVQIIVRDATHEEEIRQNLEKTAAEMARLNQMKNSFLGLASHELKTPLTIIMGYIELLTTEMADQLSGTTTEMVKHIAKAGERLSEIVRDMVDVSMLDEKSFQLVSQLADVNSLVHAAIDKVQPFINQRRQILNHQLASDLPLVRCDMERIIQAVGNILGNAIKFTPDKGRITVKTQLVTRPRLPEKFAQNGVDGACQLSSETFPYIEIAIADSGIGIAGADQDAIFDKFYEVGEVEAHSTGKVAFKGRGAGLGLTVVKGVVALHGGAVWVESPGHDPQSFPGSTFYILLPVAKSSAD
ncbi:MAG: PAS domain-containing sensor histidine kinase [Desulfuromonas sp.]|nr:MAG: PAS domain-containing sensor histidine kinase [Desulfuromonas sp.]